MSDLRTGLVEAVAKALYEAEASWIDLRRNPWDVVVKRIRVSYLHKAEAVVDSALGFLTDNAEAFGQARVKVSSEDYAGLVEGSSVAHLRLLIAALSDSRDTGDSP